MFTKPVVRWWALFATAAALVGEVTMMLVLARVLDAGDVAKGIGLAGIAAMVGSMAVRLCTDIWEATRTDAPVAAPTAPTGS